MPAKRPRYGIYRWKQVHETGRLLLIRCGCCHRRAFFDPMDLMRLYGDQDAERAPFPCSRCGTGDWMSVSFYDVRPGDYGCLKVRRPGPDRNRPTWRTVTLEKS